MPETRIVPANLDLPAAAAVLRAGDLVAFPTETVYGLGADARSAQAVAKIYAAKGRPAGNPLIVHAADLAAAEQYAKFSDLARRLGERFWPGPLTLVLPRGQTITPLVSAGRATVAIRCPRHPVAEALLRSFGGPIAAPSANRSSFTSPTTAQHVYAELNGRIPMILDGGPCQVGLESTVLDLTTLPPTILRPGAVTAEALEPILGTVRISAGTVAATDVAASPGQHDRHYAPRTPALRFTRDQWPKVQEHLRGMASPGVLLSHEAGICAQPPHETVRLPEAAADYARVLYAALREVDTRNVETLFILMPDKEDGLWLAIADRIRRATRAFT